MTLLTLPVPCHLSFNDALQPRFLQSHGRMHVFKSFVNTVTLPADQMERTPPLPALHPGVLTTERDAAFAHPALPAGLQLSLPAPRPGQVSCSCLCSPPSSFPTVSLQPSHRDTGLERSLSKQKLLLPGCKQAEIVPCQSFPSFSAPSSTFLT